MAATASDYTVLFVGNTIRDGRVQYQVKVSDADGESWFVHKRYSEMKDLHEVLRLKFPSLTAIFPPKKLFGNTDPGFIAARQQKLQQYVSAVLSQDPKCELSILRDFLGIKVKRVQQTVNEPVPEVNSDETFIADVSAQLIDLSQAPQPLDSTEVEQRQRKYRSLVADSLKHPIDPAIMVLAGDQDGPRTTTPNVLDFEAHSLSVARDGEVLQKALLVAHSLGKQVHRINGIDKLIVPFPSLH